MRLKEITPEPLLCAMGMCPAIFESEEGSTYFVIGKRREPAAFGLGHKVGEDEYLVEIPRALLDGIRAA